MPNAYRTVVVVRRNKRKRRSKMKKRKLKKRVIALAVTCVLMLTVFGRMIPKAQAASSTDKPLLSDKEIITKACELLGVKYKLAMKGTLDYYAKTVYGRDQIENTGIDCTGLIFWVLVSHNSTVKHTDQANSSLNEFPAPLATYYWHNGTSPYSDFELKRGGRSAKVPITRNKYGTYDKDYYNADNGGFIDPGSAVIMKTEDPSDEHGWIYIGYAEGGKQGIKDLLQKKYGITGIRDEDIVYNRKEGNHWRVESTAKPRFTGYNVQFYSGGRISVVTPIYKTGVVISNRRTSAGGVCTGTAVFKLAGLTPDITDD